MLSPFVFVDELPKIWNSVELLSTIKLFTFLLCMCFMMASNSWLIPCFVKHWQQTDKNFKLSNWRENRTHFVLICCRIKENLLEGAKQRQLKQHGRCLEVNSNSVKHLDNGMICCVLVLFVIFQKPAVWLEKSWSGKSKKQPPQSFHILN